MSGPLLIVFLRAPVKGRVKTRLAATMGEARALEVYQHLLRHTLNEASILACAKQAWYTDDVPDPDPVQPFGFSTHVQTGEDLGNRMQGAFAEGFNNGFGPIVIIGTDLPALSTALLEEAFGALADNDAVIGPANDGGYYLLGLKAPFHELFQQKPWSTSVVFTLTMKDLAMHGRSCHVLPQLTDVDTEEDLPAGWLP